VCSDEEKDVASTTCSAVTRRTTMNVSWKLQLFVADIVIMSTNDFTVDAAETVSHAQLTK